MLVRSCRRGDPVLADRRFAFKSCVSLLRQPDRLLAGGAIRFKALKIYLTDARPVIMAASFHRRTANGRPYGLCFLRLCHLENGNIPTFAAEHNRAGAKTTTAVFNADRFPPAAGGRAMLAPTTCIFLRLCHLDNGNIPKTSAEHNRAGAKTTIAVFNANSPHGNTLRQDGGEGDAFAVGGFGVYAAAVGLGRGLGYGQPHARAAA